MSIAPRALIVTRPTEYDEMLGRHGSRQQVAFFLKQRARSIDELDERHALQQQALQTMSASIPQDWRRATLQRGDLDRFVFGPEDIIFAVGQDGLVANVAKYLDGQPVVGINPDPERNPGVLARHQARSVSSLAAALIAGQVDIQRRAMVEIETDDGQRLRALNEIFVGHPTHQSARYTIDCQGVTEQQSSSGILVGTGTGATSWCASVHRERNLGWELPTSASTDLAWFVREAWPSPSTGTDLTSGRLTGTELMIRCQSDRLVAFGDGIESDRIDLAWGQTATVRLATQGLSLV